MLFSRAFLEGCSTTISRWAPFRHKSQHPHFVFILYWSEHSTFSVSISVDVTTLCTFHGCWQTWHISLLTPLAILHQFLKGPACLCCSNMERNMLSGTVPSQFLIEGTVHKMFPQRKAEQVCPKSSEFLQGASTSSYGSCKTRPVGNAFELLYPFRLPLPLCVNFPIRLQAFKYHGCKHLSHWRHRRPPPTRA